MEVINSDHDLENVVEMLDEDEDITDLTRPSTTPQSTKDYFEKSQVRHTPSVLTYPSLTYITQLNMLKLVSVSKDWQW